VTDQFIFLVSKLQSLDADIFFDLISNFFKNWKL